MLKHLATVCALVSVVSVTAQASNSGEIDLKREAVQAPAEVMPNISAGHISVGGDFGFTTSTYSYTEFNFNPTAEYFVADNFSLGLAVSSVFGKDFQSYGLGPSASYFFWRNGPWTSSVGGGVQYSDSKSDYAGGSSSPDSHWTANARIGVSYFFTPSVSFGPRLSHLRSVDDKAAPGITRLLFQFDVFL